MIHKRKVLGYSLDFTEEEFERLWIGNRRLAKFSRECKEKKLRTFSLYLYL
ncbi:hypothetical protein RhiirA5_353414, partial [Rhizophagus irregularis]